MPDAFAKLAATANDVGGGAGAVTSLAKLFQPGERLAGAHRVLMGAMWLMGARWRWMGALALAALVLIWLLLKLPGLLAWLIVLGLGVLGWFGWRTLRTLAEEGMGLCAGTRGTAIRQDMETLRREGALADWLHAEIQRVAGRSVGRVPVGVPADQVPLADRPLTMGDLWGEAEGAREIDLLLTTTNLTQQVAHRFPFLEKTRNRLFFKPETLAKVVPPDVVAWMVASARKPEAHWPQAEPGFLWLPEPRHLPVLLGVRLSLSFPGLIAAVPLYARDREAPARPDKVFAPRRAWFSDGGITSNFPITLFDAPLPGHPTFCITLRDATAAEAARAAGAPPPSGAKAGASINPLVIMAENNSQEMAPRFLSKDDTLAGFVSAILDTARNAQENELMLQPGQRDRIVHVLTRAGEGGLNLDMADSVITTLSARGADAARLMLARFPPEGPDPAAGITLDWRNHRWVRFRALMAAMERLLAQISASAAADARQPPGCDIATLLADPPSYRWAKDPAEAAARAEAARRAYDALLALAATMRDEAAAQGDLRHASVFDAQGDGGAPQPRSALVARPVTLDPREGRVYR